MPRLSALSRFPYFKTIPAWLLAMVFGWEILGRPYPVRANLPGGGSGTGPAVVATDYGSTLAISNGLVSIVVTKADASIHEIYYQFNNSGTLTTRQLLQGGYNGGQLYWLENPDSFVAGPFTASLVQSNANEVELDLSCSTPTNGTMDIHYTMLRGSPGFYAAIILSHRTQDGVMNITLRPNIYAGGIFNWMSVDAARNRLMEVSGGASVPVQGAPKEVYLWTNGIYSGRYEDKYKYTADLGVNRVWGWSSVGAGGANVGLWNITASAECYPGGPMERSLMEHIGTTILNVFTGGYYGLGTDDTFTNGETWSKVYGPYFYYCNNITNAITETNQAAQALYDDALSQGAAEQSAWPYAWFTNASYAPLQGRGTITGQMAIQDPGNPNASAAGLWVGLVCQPSNNISHDFQEWAKPYQYWARTDSTGRFMISNVIAGAGYTLYAFGPGAAGTFMSQMQAGGQPPILTDLPSAPFSVTVIPGATNFLSTIVWRPSRVGATVFEIGYPDRSADKFRHGDDYWVGDIGPDPSHPSPVWSKWLEYAFDFPGGVNYVAGQSRWSTDWNFIQPVVPDSAGVYQPSTSTISFQLAEAPTNGALASLYLGLCSDFYSAVIVSVNGVNAASLSGLSASPETSVPSSGYYAQYADSDTNIREGNNGAFTDERLTFSAAALHAGLNTVSISFREISPDYFADHLMYDYVRLELQGYVPSAPSRVEAYPGYQSCLVTWPVSPGATSYNLLRSTYPTSGFTPLTNGIPGPVSGSGPDQVIFQDSTAANGSTYYYEVESVNSTGASGVSTASSSVSPSSTVPANAPSAPSGLVVAGAGHQLITVAWQPSTGADFYSVWRSTLMDNGGGGSNVLSTVMLTDSATNTQYTDTSPTDGSLYEYWVTATGPGGTSGNSSIIPGKALPSIPLLPPLSLTASFSSSNVLLNWEPAPGAVGYVISRATSPSGPFTLLQSVSETQYTDVNLNNTGTYYYQVTAVNAAGVSPVGTNLVNGLQPAPTSLLATASSNTVVLAWPASPGAQTYSLLRGTSPGAENLTVLSGYSALSFTNADLAGPQTYYYVVTASGAGGVSGHSPEASAEVAASANGTWALDEDGYWDDESNWVNGTVAEGMTSIADFSSLALAGNRTVTLDSSHTIGELVWADLNAAHDWTLSGTNILTLGGAAEVEVLNGKTIFQVQVAGTNGLLKSGSGTLVLGGTAESFTNGLTVDAGELVVDTSAAGSPSTNLIAAANGLTLEGGILNLTGGNISAASQTFASTVVNAGGSAISGSSGTGTPLPVMNLNTLSESTGGTLILNGPATVNGMANVPATASITTLSAGTGALGAMGSFGSGSPGQGTSGAYATVGLNDFAATIPAAGGAGTFDIIGGSQVNGFFQSNGINDTTAAFDVPASGGVLTLGNAPGSPMVRFNLPYSKAITFTASTANGIQGILVTPGCGTNNEILAGTGSNGLEFIRSTTIANDYGVIWQNNPSGFLEINCVLQPGRYLLGGEGNSCGLVQAGSGTVEYNDANLYDLPSYLNGGFALVTNDSAFGQASLAQPLFLGGGSVVANSTMNLDSGSGGARPVHIGPGGGGLAATSGQSLTVDGVVDGSGSLVIGIPPLAANSLTPGLVPGTGSGTANTTPMMANGQVVLAASNSFTGPMDVVSGSLIANLGMTASNPAAGALGNPDVSRYITVENGAQLIFAQGNVLGGPTNLPEAILVINQGGMLTNGSGSMNTLGPLLLRGGVVTGTGGGSQAFQMFNLRGPILVQGASTSFLESPTSPNAGFHLASPSIFNVADGTGSTAPDLVCSGNLVDQDGIGTSQGHQGAPAELIKTGPGSMWLSGSNSFTGGTLVAEGSLVIRGDDSAANGPVTVTNGAILSGDGKVGGAVTLEAGGTLMPGPGFSPLQFTGSLNLNAGSTLLEYLSAGLHTNTTVQVSGNLSGTGSLVVSNLDAGSPSAGMVFQIFRSGSLSGQFSSVTLPKLPSGLYWDTNQLTTLGLIRVSSMPTPRWADIQQLDHSIIFYATNGLPGSSFVVMTSTNIQLPLTDWVPLETNSFDASGRFIITNTTSPQITREFYRIVLP